MTQIAQPSDAAPGVAADTEIATLEGMRAIGTLAAGDRVVTFDGGAQPVFWAGPVAAEGPLVRIPAGALDNDAELFVAPGQRLLWADWHAELLFGTLEVLVEAKDLIGMNGIDWTEPDDGAVWRMALAGSDMVLLGGTWCESHRPADVDEARAPRPVLSADEVRVLRSYGDYQRRAPETVRAPVQLRLVA